jgi:hypothetical protein
MIDTLLHPALWIDALAISVALWIVSDPARYAAVDKWADAWAAKWWPKWLGGGGAPNTWLQHTFAAAMFALAGTGITWLVFSEPLIGAAHGSLIGMLFYWQREVRDWRKHSAKGDTGYKFDGFMDALGPTLLAVIIWAFVFFMEH